MTKKILPVVYRLSEDYTPNGMSFRIPSHFEIRAIRILMPKGIGQEGTLVRFEAMNNLSGIEGTDWIPCELFNSFMCFPIKTYYPNEDVRLLIQNCMPLKTGGRVEL